MPPTKHKPDKTLFILVLFLIFYGLFVLASASLIKSQQLFGENYYYFKHQLIFGVLVGLGLFFLAFRIQYLFWQKAALFIFILCLSLLFLVFLPQFGLRFGGARRWMEIGGIAFQPSEFVKLSFVIYLAAWLSKKTRQMSSFRETILPFGVLNFLLGIFFILQPDLGSLLVIYSCSILMFFLAGAKYKHILVIVASGIVILLLLIYFSPYRLLRLTSFLRPEADPLASSYQVRQSLIGIGSGGIIGRGYGESFQKRGYLPEAIGDSIFVVLAEELGFVGGVVLIMSFFVLAFRGFRIAKKAPDVFSQLLASGITFLIIYQAFINIAAISGLIPLTGITLPLVSYGSSSYIATLFALGILFNISSHTS